MSEVIPLISQSAIDRAWCAYQAHVVQSIDNRNLLADRGYMEKWAKLERDWKRLFWAGENQ